MALFLMRNKSLFYEQNITAKLLQMNLENDFVQLEKAFDIYKKLLNPIINLEPYDKVGIEECSNTELFSNNQYLNPTRINFNLYLDKYKIYQSVSRWYWSQKRNIIFERMLILFEEYKKVYDKIKLNMLRNTLLFSKLLEDIDQFNSKLIVKLEILKTTYSDELVSGYIDKFIQMFKTKNSFEIVPKANENENETPIETINNQTIEEL